MSYPVKYRRDTYRQIISAADPGFILILVDQSSSMNEKFGDGTRASAAADAVNSVIYEIQKASQSGKRISDRCYVGVIGYGKTVEGVVGGMISKVARGWKERRLTRQRPSDGSDEVRDTELTLPIWVYPRGENGTPMDQAFNLAHRAVQSWVHEQPDSFPPVVINITDGAPNDLRDGGNGSATRAAARSLLELRTTDGGVLLFNAHIAGEGESEIVLPDHLPYSADRYARFLMEISSIVPDALLDTARRVGFDVRPGARGFVYNARPETLIRLLTFGSKPMT